jgi:hypothetical protein
MLYLKLNGIDAIDKSLNASYVSSNLLTYIFQIIFRVIGNIYLPFLRNHMNHEIHEIHENKNYAINNNFTE